MQLPTNGGSRPQAMASRIAAMRRRRKLSQWQLAAATNTSRRTIQRIERGQWKQGPRAELLVQLAAALRCKVGDLLPPICGHVSERVNTKTDGGYWPE